MSYLIKKTVLRDNYCLSKENTHIIMYISCLSMIKRHYISLTFIINTRACLKNAFCQMCVTIQASWTTNVQDDVEDLTRMGEA